MSNDGFVDDARVVACEADTAKHVAHCTGLGDERLIRILGDLVRREREDIVELLFHLAEFDKRRLYEPLGSSSLFAYCTRVLGYSEGSAAKRIQSERAAAKYPSIFGMLKRGEIHMSALVMLAPHLNPENHRRLLRQAQGKTRRELELMTAGLSPRADTADLIRRIKPAEVSQRSAAPSNGVGSSCAAISCAAAPGGEELSVAVPNDAVPARFEATVELTPRSVERIEPLSAQRVKFSFTAGVDLIEKVEKARGLLRHKHPFGRLEEVFAEALDWWLKSNDPERRLEYGKRRLKGLRAKRAGDGIAAAVSSDPFLVLKPRRSISR